ncbi:MAG: AI-2E family transporter [Lactobacillales bacterium]|jgi:predicted PurR-regulated permease PerM|nr:AI-2E family transporter [Lactobacillales bacterium]
MKKYKIEIILGVSLLALIAFICSIQSILLPFVFAFILAYFLHPAVQRLQKFKINRTVATFIVVTLFCVFVVGIFLILIPILQSQVFDFLAQTPKVTKAVWEYLQHIIVYTKQNITQEQLSQVSQAVSQNIFKVINAAGSALLKVFSGGAVIFNIITLVLITPIVLFYVLRDWQGVSDKLESLIPKEREAMVKNIWGEINQTLSGFIRGQIAVCLSLAVYYAVAFTAIGLELGVLIGVLAGVLSFIPYFGFLIALVLSIVLGLSQGGDLTFWVLLATVLAIGQLLEGYVLTPKLVGKKVGLHPVWVIFALFAGGVLFGFIGILTTRRLRSGTHI